MRDPEKTFGPNNVLVIRPGDECWVGKEIKATVVGCSLKPAGMGEISVAYQCAWWDGNNRRCEWLEEHEVEPISRNCGTMRIGFQAN